MCWGVCVCECVHVCVLALTPWSCYTLHSSHTMSLAFKLSQMTYCIKHPFRFLQSPCVHTLIQMKWLTKYNSALRPQIVEVKLRWLLVRYEKGDLDHEEWEGIKAMRRKKLGNSFNRNVQAKTVTILPIPTRQCHSAWEKTIIYKNKSKRRNYLNRCLPSTS